MVFNLGKAGLGALSRLCGFAGGKRWFPAKTLRPQRKSKVRKEEERERSRIIKIAAFWAAISKIELLLFDSSSLKRVVACVNCAKLSLNRPRFSTSPHRP